MPDLSSPVIRYSAFGGTLVKDGPRGQYAGADVLISAPALAVALDADSATYQLMTPTADINVTMPSSVGTPGKRILIRNTTATANVITVLQHADDGGGAIQFVGPGEEKVFVSTGTVANNWVLVQHQPTTANTNNAALAANVILGSSELLARQYQNLDPGGANRTVTLPLSDNSPGEIFHIRNNADAFETLQVIPNAGDPAGDRFVLPGDELVVVSSPTLGFLTVEHRRNTTIQAVATGAAAVALLDRNAMYQEIAVDEGAAPQTQRLRTVDLPAPVATLLGRRIVIRNTSATFDSVLQIRTSAAVVLIELAPQEVAEFILTTIATDWALASFWRANTIAQQAALAGPKTLTSGSPTYQFLNPNGVRVVTLPSALLSPSKRFVIRNIGVLAADRLTVTADAADAGGGSFPMTLFPGDQIEVVSTGATGFLPNQGFQPASSAAPIQGFETIAAIASGATTALTDANGRFLRASHAGGGGATATLAMPARSQFNRGKFYVIRGAASGGAGETLTIANAAADGGGAIEVVLVAASPRVIILFNDGAAWQTFGQMTTT